MSIDNEVNSNVQKVKSTYFIVALICFVGSLISLFLPYLEKLNVHSGNPALPKTVEGFHFLTAGITLLFMLLTVTSKNNDNGFVFSSLSLVMVYFTRNAIHYQGFIDHDYDSQTGFGFHLIFSFSIILFFSTVIYSLKMYRMKRKVSQK